MKTQVLKNNETVKASNSMMIFTMIIFGGLLLYAANKTNLQFDSSSSDLQSPYENKQLLLKMNHPYNAVNSDNKAIEAKAADVQFSMGKMHEYLIPANESEIEINEVLSITFPDVEPVELTADNALSNDQFLKDLKIQASEKIKESIEYYTLEKKMKEYITIETEQPLQLEAWMTDEKCWCRSLQEPTALTEKK